MIATPLKQIISCMNHAYGYAYCMQALLPSNSATMRLRLCTHSEEKNQWVWAMPYYILARPVQFAQLTGVGGSMIWARAATTMTHKNTSSLTFTSVFQLTKNLGGGGGGGGEGDRLPHRLPDHLPRPRPWFLCLCNCQLYSVENLLDSMKHNTWGPWAVNMHSSLR